VGSYWKPVAIGGAILGGIGLIVLVGRKSTPSKTAPKRVALIGDSYAVGLGPELAKLFPNFRFEGHVGTTSSQWAYHSAACGTCGDWLTSWRPDTVLVSLGVNDHFSPAPPISGVPVRPYTGSYQQIVSALHGIGARVVWIEPPAAVNAPSARAAIASLGVQTVPATTVPLAADGLHPRSYSQWAHDVAAAVTA
jgi:hypothetical protein